MKYGWPHKFYVNIPNRDPDALFVVGSTSAVEPPNGEAWVAWEDLTAEQAAVAKRDGYDRDDGFRRSFLLFGTRDAHFGKFYTIHLSDADLPADVKQQLEQHSGVAFEFNGDRDRVSWRRHRNEGP